MIKTISGTREAYTSSISKYSSPVFGDTIQSSDSSSSAPGIDKNLIKKVFSNIGYFNPDSSTDVEFFTIKKLYSLINENELKQYLEVNPFLYVILINAAQFIKENIGKTASASLELYTFVEDGSKAIFLSVFVSEDSYNQEDIEEAIVDNIFSYSSKPLNGRIVVSVA
jgi:hypothetical protein